MGGLHHSAAQEPAPQEPPCPPKPTCPPQECDCTHSNALQVVHGNIANPPVPVDAVVNAANSMLETGGGVTGALVQGVGGDAVWSGLVREARFFSGQSQAFSTSEHLPLATCTQVAWTGSGQLPAPIRAIFHAVGPMCSGVTTPSQHTLLRTCYATVLDAVETANVQHQALVRSVMFPVLSAGCYGCRDAEKDAIHSITQWLLDHPHRTIQTVYVIIYGTSSPDDPVCSGA